MDRTVANPAEPSNPKLVTATADVPSAQEVASTATKSSPHPTEVQVPSRTRNSAEMS